MIITYAWIWGVDVLFFSGKSTAWGFLLSNFHGDFLNILDSTITQNRQLSNGIRASQKLRNNQHDLEWTFGSIYRFHRSSTKETEMDSAPVHQRQTCDRNFTKNSRVADNEDWTLMGTASCTNQPFTTTKLELEESGKWIHSSQTWQRLPHAPSMNEHDHSIYSSQWFDPYSNFFAAYIFCQVLKVETLICCSQDEINYLFVNFSNCWWQKKNVLFGGICVRVCFCLCAWQ